MTEAIHPPLDHLSLPHRKRFEAFLTFFAQMLPGPGPWAHGTCKRAAEAALRTQQALVSKDDNHPAVVMMPVMVVVMVPPVVAIVVVVVVMMVMMHAVSRRRLNGGGQCACGKKNGYDS
ncbi:hypothetical protein [Mesorhizobium sp. WSM4315]|uniref:hypothetical protein n=1 Tax=Mesorhizobium sp. WSM4315 TaxID=2589882 RepID=UPI001AEDF4D6|nr:hypothetical protein [Mesorhizobium sp. WSM4315]